MLAAIDGHRVIEALVMLVVWAMILWLCWWGLGKIAPGEPWNKIGTVILVLATVFILINILLTLVDRPLIKW